MSDQPDQLPALQDRGIEYATKAGYRLDEANFHRVFYAYCAGFTDGSSAERARADALQAEVEQLRVQLAGCGVAAMGNTRESWARNNEVKQGVYGWSASYADCLKAAKREIEHRERADALEAALKELVDSLASYAIPRKVTAIAAARALLEKPHGS